MATASFGRVPALAAGLALVLGLTACGSAPVVGILLPTSGEASTYGDSIESGIRVALTEARELNDLPEGFEVVWADSESDPATAVAELRRLARERNVKMVIGGATSDEARALIPVLDELNLVCLSPSASAPDLAKKSKHFFRIYPSDELEGSRAGQFLYDKLRAKTTLVFVGDTEYTRGIEPEFQQQYVENLGGKIVARISILDADWQDRARTLLDRESPQAVYIIGYADDIAQVIRFLRERNYEGRVVTTSAFYSGQVIQDLGEMANGIFFPLPPFDRMSEDELVQRFVKRYMDTYQRAPDIFAAHGYDVMRIVIAVMKIAKPPETVEIEKALHFGISEFKGVTGPILFDDYGEVKHYPKMFIVNDGNVVSYDRHIKLERSRIRRQVLELLGSKK